MIRFLKFLFRLNFKTLYFNFTYLPFHQAKKLPFLVSRKVYLSQTKGVVSIEGPITATVPASSLQMHPDATWVVTEDAAVNLQLEWK